MIGPEPGFRSIFGDKRDFTASIQASSAHWLFLGRPVVEPLVWRSEEEMIPFLKEQVTKNDLMT